MQNMQHNLVYNPPGLAELVTFIALADTLSFQLAAGRLRRDATVISRRLKALEKRLGVRLIERNTRSMALTEAGEIYAEQIRDILRLLDEADSSISQFIEGEPRGNLRISLPEGFGRLWISPLISQFLQRYPLISIDAEYDNRYVDLIGERFDLAIRLGELNDSRLIARRIGSRRRSLYASPGYLSQNEVPAQPVDLAMHSCLVWTKGPSRNRWELKDTQGRSECVSVKGVVVSDNAEALVSHAESGLGIVMAADWLAYQGLNSGRLVKILPDWNSVSEGGIYVVSPVKSGAKSKSRIFSDWIIDKLGSQPWS